MNDRDIIALIDSEGLDTVLVGIEIVRAMREYESMFYTGDREFVCYEAGKRKFRVMKNGKNELFESPLAAIHALLSETDITKESSAENLTKEEKI